MVVILIIGLMAAIVFPRLDFVSPRHTLTTAANFVLAAVADARAEARLKRLDVELVYDFAAGTVSIQEPDASAPAPSYGPAPEPVVLLTSKLPEGVTIARIYHGINLADTNGVTTTIFRPSGTVAEHMVVLEDANKRTISIFVPALTGAAFVVEGELPYAEVRSSRRLR
jgi:Tfp pilus assembly protein FimT